MTQGAPPSQHVETGDLAGRAPLVNFQQLADADRQRQALASRGVLQTSLKLAAVKRRHRARVQAQPAHRHRQSFRVVLGKVGEIEFDPRVGERDLLAIATEELTAGDEVSRVESTRRGRSGRHESF